MNVLAAKAGLDHLHPHQFRRTFAHDFLMNGGQERDLKRLAGWSSDVKLERYGASAADVRDELVLVAVMVLGSVFVDGFDVSRTPNLSSRFSHVCPLLEFHARAPGVCPLRESSLFYDYCSCGTSSSAGAAPQPRPCCRQTG